MKVSLQLLSAIAKLIEGYIEKSCTYPNKIIEKKSLHIMEIR